MAEHASLILIIGNDPAAVELRLNELLRKAEKKAGTDLDVHRHDASEMSVQDFKVLADSQTLLGGPLVHVFKNPAFLVPKAKGLAVKKSEQDRLLAYAANPNPDSLLVITAEIEKSPNAFQKKLMSLCKSLRADQPEAGELTRILDCLAEEHGKSWSGPARQELLRLQGRVDLGRIINEAEKILLFASKEEVSREEALALLAPNPELGIFHLLDAVFEGRGRDSLEAWRDCQSQGEHPGKVFFMLADQARRLLLVQSYVAQGASMSTIQKAAGRPAFVVKKNIRQAKALSQECLVNALDLILTRDFERKTNVIEDENAFIDRMLVGLSATLQPNTARKFRGQ